MKALGIVPSTLHSPIPHHMQNQDFPPTGFQHPQLPLDSGATLTGGSSYKGVPKRYRSLALWLPCPALLSRQRAGAIGVRAIWKKRLEYLHCWGPLGARLRLPLCLQCALDSSPIPGRNQISDPPASTSGGRSGPLRVGLSHPA